LLDLKLKQLTLFIGILRPGFESFISIEEKLLRFGEAAKHWLIERPIVRRSILITGPRTQSSILKITVKVHVLIGHYIQIV
jgi:hypothetical protein